MNAPLLIPGIVTITAFFVGVQVMLVVAVLINYSPSISSIAGIVFPEWHPMMQPHHQVLIYQLTLVVLAIALSIACVAMKRIKVAGSMEHLVARGTVELIVTFFLLVCVFKQNVSPDRAQLAGACFWIVVLFALLNKIFFTEIFALLVQMAQWVRRQDFQRRRWVWLGVVGIILLLYVPDANAVLARMFFGEQFHHFDSFMAPIWAYTKGNVLNMDTMSEYGIGLPIMVSGLAQWLGGVSYLSVFQIWLWMAVVYFIAFFVFVRVWTQSFPIAVLALAVAIKWQMFHPGVTPFIFTFPSTTVARFFFDIPFFMCLWAHLRFQQPVFVLAAGAIAGYMIFYMPTIGYCVTMAFMTYLLACVIVPQWRRECFSQKRHWLWLIAWAGIVPLVAQGCLFLSQGPSMGTEVFKHNMHEFNHYFLSGFGLMPMSEILQNKQSLAFAMGLWIPLVYVGSLVYLASRLLFAQGPVLLILPLVISLYGLAMYHYFVARSAVTSYYVVVVPYVMMLAFWLKTAVQQLNPHIRRRLYGTLLAVLVVSLVTTHNYVGYPNLWCVTRSPMVDPKVVQPLSDSRSYFNQLFSRIPDTEKLPVNNLGTTDEGLTFEKDYPNDKALVADYLKESDFSDDAALIASKTAPNEKVPLLSSFEVKMLIEANRAPFFYYSHILIARPMRMRTLPNSTMYTTHHLERTLRQFNELKPPHLFMEKVFLQQGQAALYKDPALAYLVDFLLKRYEVDVEGKYIVALKLRG